jgi:hypothetical protein
VISPSTRQRLAVAGALVAAAGVLTGVLGQAGAANAQDDPSPSAQPLAADPSTSPPANQPPTAVPDSGTTTSGQSITLDVVANDTDPDNDPLHLVSVDTVDGRAAAVNGRVVFSARVADTGSFPFHYVVSDGTHEVTGDVAISVVAPPVPRQVTISMPKTVVALHHYAVSGKANVLAHGPIDVAVQRYYSGGWHAWKTDRADAAGRYAVPFTSNRTKKFVFRAVASWADGKRATSAKLSRTVVARVESTVSGPLSRSDVPYSYRSGCPVGPSGLRRITINRFTYSGTVARGSLVVRASAVPAITNVFKAAFAARFPVRSMKPTDAFYAGGARTPTQSDVAAMRADNTSAFNCRPVTGNPYRVSQHSYGNAIDINTVRNPYVVGSRVYPSFARTYLNRSNVRKGMITRRGVIATRFRNLGWPWGARWSHPDYQHFSSNGG